MLKKEREYVKDPDIVEIKIENNIFEIRNGI